MRLFEHAPTVKSKKILDLVDPTKVSNEVAKLRVFDDAAEKMLTQEMRAASNNLGRLINDTGKELREVSTKLERAMRNQRNAQKRLALLEDSMTSFESPVEAQAARQQALREIQEYEDLIPEFRAKQADLSQVYDELNDLSNLANDTPPGFVKAVTSNPVYAEMTRRFKPLSDLKHSMSRLLEKRVQIDRALSPNINNTKSFLMEYITQIAPKADNSIVKQRWMMNPKNMAKLDDVLNQPGLRKYIQKTIGKRYSPEQIAKGKIPKDLLDLANAPAPTIAKKLGIAVGAAAGVAGVLKLYSWFDDSDSVQTAARGTLKDVKAIKVEGSSKVIVDKVVTALEATEEAYAKAKSDINSESSQASLTKYTIAVAKLEDVVEKALPHWNVVISSAENPNVAKRAGIALENLQNSLEDHLSELEVKVTGDSSFTGQKQEPQKPQVPGIRGAHGQPSSKEDLIAVQEMLSQNNPYVGATGRFDKETVNALQRLEQSLNAKHKTDRFTGLLVNPDRKSAITAPDLERVLREF